MFINKETVSKAREVDLHGFLLSKYPDLFKKTSNNLYLKGNSSLVIHVGARTYHDFATGEAGNGIDFLMNHLNYSFQEAVLALTEYARPCATTDIALGPVISGMQHSRAIQLPSPAPFPHSRMYAFLMSRGIPAKMIRHLTDQGLLYQSAERNNVVFVNHERDYFELRGTCTFSEKPFHGCGKTRSDRFWYFKGGNIKPDRVYITEGAIDAISLFLLHRQGGYPTDKSVYTSIGGVSNYTTIDRISRQIRTVLAVDNDKAGDLCRQHYPDLEFILPVHKDWNEDLNFNMGG